MKRSSSSSSSAPAKKPKLPINFGASEASPCSTKQDALEALKAWFNERKFQGVSNLDFDLSESCGNSLGAFAKKTFKAGDLLFTVPADAMISMRDVAKSSVVQFTLSALETRDELKSISVEFCLWLFLIEAKFDSHSRFHTYLQSLSDESPSILSWEPTIQNLLNDTNLSSSLQSLKTALEGYSQVLDNLRSTNTTAKDHLPVEQYNFNNLLWAAGHYLSRRYPFHFASQEESTLPAQFVSLERLPGLGNLGTLVPCLDILNHSHQKEYLEFDVTSAASITATIQEGDLQVKSKVDVAPGQELFSNYGSISNGQLMFAYGYAIANNPHDEFLLKVKLPAGVSATTSSDAAANGLFALKRGGFHGIPKELFAVFKVMIRMSEGTGDDDDEEDEDAENALVVDEECLDLLYSYLTTKLLRLHALFVASVKASLHEDCYVDLEVPFPGGVRHADEDGEEGELSVPMILTLRPCKVTALALPRHHGREEELKQQRGLFVAHYLAGQFEILLEVMKDLQSMMGGGEDDEGDGDEGEGDDDEEEEDDDDDDA